jgi:signal transduction histidine kinase/CheY-like chemotaxis protein
MSNNFKPPQFVYRLPPRMRDRRMLLLYVIGLVFILAIMLLGFLTPSLASEASRYGGIAAISMTLILLTMGVPLQIGLSLAAVYIAADVTWVAWSNQGIYSPSINWLYIIPILMSQMVGRRAGWLWTGIIALLFLFMTVATHQSWLPQMIDYDKSHEVYGLVVYVVTTASLIGVNLFYQGFANETIQNIKDRNHELELKRQDLQAILDTRDQFIASVSHELRTPMNAIMGFNELLKDHQANNPKVQEILNLTHQSGEHLLTVINDVLDYSQFQSGKLGIHPEAFVLSQVADSASGLFVNRIKSMRLAFQQEVDPSLPIWILADRHRLMQVLVNLLGNAIKFTQQGHVKLRITKQQELIRFEVADTGIGISPEQQALVFERFSQATAQTQDLYGGNGLGLAISKRLVELMGGAIGVQSTLGVGSCFWFTLPLIEALPAQINQDQDNAGTSDFDQRAWRFLIVDDMAINRLLLRQMLQMACPQAKISEAENGLSALSIMKISSFDLVFMDMLMPQMDGIEASKRIRTDLTGPAGQTPILGLTANVNAIDRERFIQAGANGFLLKPFDRKVLMKTTERLLMSSKKTPASSKSSNPEPLQ